MKKRICVIIASVTAAIALTLEGCSGCVKAATTETLNEETKDGTDTSSGTSKKPAAESTKSGAKETTKSGDTETETSGAQAPGDTATGSAAAETSGEGGTSGRTETTAGTTTGTTAAANSTTATTAAATPHEHSWVPQYTTGTVVDQEAYDETVVDQAAYDEQVYETHMICRGCGCYVDSMTQDEIDAHMKKHILAEEKNGWYDSQVQTGTIHHDAVTHTVHHDAVTHTEQQLTGYKCSTCGATK